MKTKFWYAALLLSGAHLLQAQVPVSQPVYVYLYARVTDQVNVDVSEDRLRHVLPMIERYKADHPDAHISATILFSGAISEVLDQRNSKTHIKDMVLDYKKRGVIEVGYDGTDEPTYERRPMSSLSPGKTAEERWLARADADEKFLTEARDPLTGAAVPGSVGGLKKMQLVFGEAAAISGASVGEAVQKPMLGARETGVGVTPNVKPEVGDWEIAALIRRYDPHAILFGLPEANPAHIPGFKGSIMGLGKLMSPVSGSSPELFWADNILRSAEASSADIRVIHGYEGPETIKEFAGKLDRSKIRIVHMELASEKDYLKPDFGKAALSPSLSYAYAHPERPTLPAEVRLTADEVSAAYVKEEASLKWVANDFFAANPGSRFVSSLDLPRMTPPSTGYSISVAGLSAALATMLATWGNDTFPPDYLLADGHYLSLAEMFQVMTDSFAEMDRTGKLPQSVQVVRVYGPIGMAQGHGPNVGEVSVAAIAKECSTLTARLHDDSANPLPKNTVPSTLEVGGIGVNAAQFLRMMAEAMVHPTPDAKVRVRMTYMTPVAAEIFPKTRLLEDTGATWTFKPAPLGLPLPSARASR